MKIADIRREFLLLEHMHDLDKRLLRVFELGVRAGAEKMSGWNYVDTYDNEIEAVEVVTRLVMDKVK